MKLPKTHQPWNTDPNPVEDPTMFISDMDNSKEYLDNSDATLGLSQDEGANEAKTSRFVVAVCVAVFLLLLLLSLFLTQCVFNSKPLAGSRLLYRGDLTAQEAQTLANDVMEKSRITVSLAPAPRLSDGKLAMNFVVNERNNGFSERFEIEQGGQIIYRSPVIAPGRILESVEAPQAALGEATVTVFAVDGGGEDHGNPVSVEIDINE